MLEAITYEDLIRDIDERRNGIIGILIANPGSEFVRFNIYDRISQFHHRSGKSSDFYLPGYGAYWYERVPDAANVFQIDGTQWSFSNKEFSDFINELEDKSKYKFSGETELLLLEVINGEINFDNVIIIWLDKMLKDGVIYSVSNLFENIFRVMKESNSLNNISNRLAFPKLIDSILDEFKDKMWVKVFRKTKYFCTRNLSK
ncbi:hypothetical protein ABFY48_18380 [Lysinibacillus pakistanensis]|uniref:hypothetical protein n=1 Tax=Lysinibacillus pakistanensis TaxID=759811 RepID=UPI003D2B35A4